MKARGGGSARTLLWGAATCAAFGAFEPNPSRMARVVACPEPDSTAAWLRVNRAWHTPLPARWANDSLRRVLIALRDEDQKLRADFGARATDTAYIRRLTAADSALADVMKGILDRFGLPTKAMVGADASDAGMLVIQHNWPLQERALAIADSLPPGQISPQAHAMLEDRVHAHQGKPQRFGTHFNLGKDGLFELAPVTDTAGLDARRATMGIMPMRDYICLLEEAGMKVNSRVRR
jgi:hypothetical protein